MPQLQQFADRHATAPHKGSEVAPLPINAAASPLDALPLCPPVPTAVLFNTANGIAYQLLLSPFDSAIQPAVCVFTVQRVWLFDTRVLAAHVQATTLCGLPFCTVEGGVTWRDVLVTLALVAPLLRNANLGWNVQVLGLDTGSGGWLSITPALSSPLEAHCFLQTNVEVLFEHYATETLHMQAGPLLPSPTGVDWHTPSERGTTTGQASPPAPTKNYNNAPPPRVCLGDSSQLSPPTFNSNNNDAHASASVVGPPRSLAQDFEVAHSHTQRGSEESLAASPPSGVENAAWSLAAFHQQQARWAQRYRELRTRTQSMTVDQVLRYVNEDLQRQKSVHLPPSNATAGEKGSATWTLSLLEFECQLFSEKVHDICTMTEAQTTSAGGENGEAIGEEGQEVMRTCRAALRHIEQRAAKVRQVVDAVWRAGEAAEASGAVPGDFPTGWLCLLLTSLLLRCLRHLAFVYACTNLAQRTEEEGTGGEEGAAALASHNSAQAEGLFITKTELLHESEQTAGLVLEALVLISEAPEDAQLPPAALSATLLTITLSLVEIAAYLPMDTAQRCVLLRASVHVCRIRLQSLGPRGDITWLPRCVEDLAARMQSKLSGIPLTSAAFAAYAELTELLRDTGDFAADLNAAAELPPLSDKVEAAEEYCEVMLGYTLQHIPTTAAVDAAFVRGNTAVREFRRRATALPPPGLPSADVAQEDVQTTTE